MKLQKIVESQGSSQENTISNQSQLTPSMAINETNQPLTNQVNTSAMNSINDSALKPVNSVPVQQHNTNYHTELKPTDTDHRILNI